MKYIILSAGKGTRFGEYCEGKPKSMLELKGKPLMQYHIDCAAKFNLEPIVIKGYNADKIHYNIKSYINKDYDKQTW